MFVFGIEGFLFALIAFAGLIFFHELGHFIGAQISGIKVEEFALGFGPAIFKFTFKGVVYRLNWVPFGGYCKMKGQDDLGKDKPTTDPDDYFQRPGWARLVTASAGPIFNLAIGVVIFGLFLFSYGEGTFLGMPQPVYHDTTIAVHQKYAENQPEFPFRTGDRITAINGHPTHSNIDIIRDLFFYLEEECQFSLIREGKPLQISYKPPLGFMNPGWRSYFVFTHQEGFVIRVDPSSNATASNSLEALVENGLPSQQALVYHSGNLIGTGLQDCDTIVGAYLNDRFFKINTINDLQWSIQSQQKPEHPYDVVSTALNLSLIEKESALQPVTLLIARNHEYVEAVISPKFIRLKNGYVMGPLIGVTAEEIVPSTPKRYPFFEAMAYGAVDGWYYLAMNLKLARLLFTGDISPSDGLAGPIGIFATLITLGEQSHFSTFLWWVALISLLLGFFNLLPIPVLDGGHIFVTGLEMIRRRRFRMETIQRIQMVGLMLMLGLLLFATFNDIQRLVFGG